jgi:prephenate dehydrogenase
MRVAFLGLGLIGGSIARALAALPDGERPTLVAWTPSGAGTGAALAAGVIDAAASGPGEAIEGASLVVLAGPPTACRVLVEGIAGELREALADDATVTDVASTKVAIVAAADDAGLPFVGGHPMAGRETSGFAAGSAELFTDRPWVIVPGASARPVDVERVEWLARACGARPMPLRAADHDAAVAAISHLPLVVSAALVEAVVGLGDGPDRSDWPAAQGLAASGWASMTRLARGDPRLGAGILATNGEAIAGRLHDLRSVIDLWIAALERGDGPDEAGLSERLAAVQRRLEERQAET